MPAGSLRNPVTAIRPGGPTSWYRVANLADSQALRRCTRSCSLLAGRRRSPPPLRTRQTIPVLAHVPPATSPRPSSKGPAETREHVHRFPRPHRERPVQSRDGSRMTLRTPIPCHSTPSARPCRLCTWQLSHHKTGNTSVRDETDTASAFDTTRICHTSILRDTLRLARTLRFLGTTKIDRRMYFDIRRQRS